MLGNDLVLPGSLVRDPRLDYVALGHIHKPQDLNENAHPPVIYPGSIERVDFGEIEDNKFFIIADIERGRTRVEWRQLEGIRPFISRYVCLDSQEGIGERLRASLPSQAQMQEAVVRLIIEYPREWASSTTSPA
jgi:exonuclease SbcD